MCAMNGKKLVFIVEDDRDVRDSLIDALELNDYAYIAVSNGREGIERLRALAVKPCLILLDLMMPILDGWGFREAQRGNPELSAIPVIVLTAGASAEQVAAQMGADGFLRKPVRLEDLIEAVSQYC